MSDLLDEYEKQTGHSVPIHVDGASGAFVAPFATVCIFNIILVWSPNVPNSLSSNGTSASLVLFLSMPRESLNQTSDLVLTEVSYVVDTSLDFPMLVLVGLSGETRPIFQKS